MKSTVLFMLLGWLTAMSAKAEEAPPSLERLDAVRAVREGNRRLRGGDAAAALEAYRHAEKLRPDASEIPFVKGIGHYNLREFEEARQAFQQAALSKNRGLADDAIYGIGAAHHAEALALKENPQEAISRLESAMEQYRTVLADRTDHQGAREAYTKAALMRRQLKELLKQQQQQQQQNQDQQQKDENQEPQPNQDQQPKPGEQQDEKKNESQQNQPQDSDQQDKKEEQQQQAQSQEQREQQQEAQARQQEKVSQEQTERRLREMMQAQRERKKRRPEVVPVGPVAPVDKDW